MPQSALSTPTSVVGSLTTHLRRIRHDLRTPITGILGYSELILEECPVELRPDILASLVGLIAHARSLAAAVDDGSGQVETRADAHELPTPVLTRLVGVALRPHLEQCQHYAEQAVAGIHGCHNGILDDLGRVITDIHILQRMISVRDPKPDESQMALIALEPRASVGILDVPGNILIVDDSQSGRDMLSRRLSRDGHQVIQVESSRDALLRLAQGNIDLVLSDVLLPGESGLVLCRRIRLDPALVAIPVILVTALHERADRLAGIEAGANDFLSKPIDGPDLMLRVRNALRAKRQYDAVLTANRRQKELEEMRDHLTHLIVHDLRQPLSGLCGYLELFQQRSAGEVEQKLRDLVDRADFQARQLVRLVNQVLDVSRLESGRLPMDIEVRDIIATVAQGVAALGPPERVPVRLQATVPVLPWPCDHALIGRVITNLVGNGLRFNPPGEFLEVGISREGDASLRVTVADHGPGIDPAYHQRIFEKFGQVAARRDRQSVTSGLGLFFSKLAVELHGGRIGVDSAPGQGARFWFTLPDDSTVHQ